MTDDKQLLAKCENDNSYLAFGTENGKTFRKTVVTEEDSRTYYVAFEGVKCVGVTIAQNEQWLPGIFDTEATADYACEFSNAQLHEVQTEKNKTTGMITTSDLRRYRCLKMAL